MTALDVGLLMLGVTTGLIFAAHGAQKAFGWFGGQGMQGWTGMVASLGFHPASLFAWLGMLTELVGGLGLALGVMTSVAAALIVAQSVVIVFHVHWRHGFWNTNRGIEYPLLLAVAAVFLGLVGRGTLSIDGLISSPLFAADGGLGPARSMVPPLTARIALLLAGAVVGSIALAAPRLSRSRRSADEVGKGGVTR